MPGTRHFKLTGTGRPNLTTMVQGPVTAVVLAAGEGTRMASATPKVMVELAGRPMLAWSVGAFGRTPEVDAIVVVAHPKLVPEVAALLEDAPKVEGIVPGGNTRSASTLAALNIIAAPTGTVLVHDAARPLIEPRIISRLIATLRASSAATVAVPARDTIVETAGGTVTDVLDRSHLWHAQTPQGFSLTTLRAAYAAAGPHADFTDDCGLVRRYMPSVAIHVVPGSDENIKVTVAADIQIAEMALRSRGGTG